MTFYTHPVAIEAEAFREWQGHVRSELAVAGRCYSMIDVDARGCRALAQSHDTKAGKESEAQHSKPAGATMEVL
jgi:hypothetical protein